MADDIIARKDALAQGLKYYFTGKPCKNGHVSKRWSVHRTCVGCINDFHARWYAANRDAKLQKNKRYQKEKPEANRRGALKWRNKNIEKARATANLWFKENPEKRRDLARRKYRSNPELYKEHNRAWIKKNPEKKAVVDRRRRAREKGAEGSHTAADLVAILKAQKHRCAYCRADLRKVKRQVDHIQALSCGGSNDRTNLQYTCGSCNLKKRAKDPIAFAQELGRLL